MEMVKASHKYEEVAQTLVVGAIPNSQIWLIAKDGKIIKHIPAPNNFTVSAYEVQIGLGPGFPDKTIEK